MCTAKSREHTFIFLDICDTVKLTLAFKDLYLFQVKSSQFR